MKTEDIYDFNALKKVNEYIEKFIDNTESFSEMDKKLIEHLDSDLAMIIAEAIKLKREEFNSFIN